MSEKDFALLRDILQTLEHYQSVCFQHLPEQGAFYQKKAEQQQLDILKLLEREQTVADLRRRYDKGVL